MGYFRLFLSLVVMVVHLAATPDRAAGLAVTCFYMISGYLSALKMSRPGAKPVAFLVSRWIRLWPVYLCIFLATLIGFNVGLIDSIGGGITGWRFVLQAFMVAPAIPIGSIIAPAWMLKYILLGYLLIAFGAAKTPTRSAIGLVVSMLWANSIPASAGLPYGGYYLSAAFALQFIFAGACTYHLGITLPRDGRWAAWAGALSYPVFLSHYGIGAAVASATGWAVGWPLFFAALPPTLALSWLLVVAVERPIARYRKKFQLPSKEI